MILATIKQFNQKQLILVQGEDSKKGHLIYLTRKGSFQVILYKMIRFLSGKLKKHTKLAKIAFLLTDWSFLWTLTNFNRFSHPMTIVICIKAVGLSLKEHSPEHYHACKDRYHGCVSYTLPSPRLSMQLQVGLISCAAVTKGKKPLPLLVEYIESG